MYSFQYFIITENAFFDNPFLYLSAVCGKILKTHGILNRVGKERGIFFMNENDLRCYLEQYKEGSLSQDDLCTLLQQERCGFADLGFAHVDLARNHAAVFPRSFIVQGKTAEQSVSIIETLFQRSAGNILATKCSEEIFAAVKPKIPAAEYHPFPKH